MVVKQTPVEKILYGCASLLLFGLLGALDTIASTEEDVPFMSSYIIPLMDFEYRKSIGQTLTVAERGSMTRMYATMTYSMMCNAKLQESFLNSCSTRYSSDDEQDLLEECNAVVDRIQHNTTLKPFTNSLHTIKKGRVCESFNKY